MTRFYARLLSGLTCVGLLWSPSLASAQTAGAAQNFALVAGQQITAAGAASIFGDVGLSTGTSITGFPPAVVVPPFILHVPNDGPSIAAQAATGALFTSLTTAGGPATVIPDALAGQVLGPGTYSLGAALLASGGTLTLTGGGLYVFRVASSLTTVSTSNIALIGANQCNIWWQVGSSATLGGATFAGTVVGFTGINSLGPNATLLGRLLTTIPGSITLAGNNIVNDAPCATGTPTPTPPAPPAPVPTLPPAFVLFLALGLIAIGYYRLRRRDRQG
jgi:hypothetical protein